MDSRPGLAEPARPPALSRRDRKKERTRREIYETAMGLFAKDGFTAVTIAQICETADVGRGTFFLHFPSKAALLYEFNERIAEDFRIATTIARSSAREELRALVERIGVELASEAEIMSAMLAEFFTSPETLAAAPKQSRGLADLVTEIISRGQANGEFDRSLDPHLAGAAFLATAAAFLSSHVTRGCELSDRETQRQFMQLTFNGLCAAEPATAHNKKRQEGNH